eukprot:TRINITY_DN1779_c0_g2_i1.p1 TRINITY_DN1779_c0_g2~~TRINITY_DN1779_c0_g2_i1.p1  ORF type:complete len:609 (+),score=196.16 TRINITY_DN1779_c0_g2_i1:31-1857(+)
MADDSNSDAKVDEVTEGVASLEVGAGGDAGAEAATEDEVDALFDVGLIKLVHHSRQQNGLRHANYERYRRYCSRRLQRLRKSVKISHGKRNFIKRELNVETVTSERHLLLPLFQAERAWSYALQMKEAEHTNANRARHFMIRKMGRAVKAADKLEELTAVKGNSRMALEAQAYAAWMNGNLHLERENWQGSLECFAKANTIYESLAKAGDHETQEICLLLVEDLEPNIRYCKYNLGGDSADLDAAIKGHGAMLNDKLEKVLEESRREMASSLTEIKWMDRTVPIKNEKLRMAFLSAQQAGFEADQAAVDDIDAKLEFYDKLFVGLGDAGRILSDEEKEITRLGEKKSAKKLEAQLQNVRFLQRYIAHLRLQRVIERNRLLVVSLKRRLRRHGVPSQARTPGKPSKPDDLVRLYETLIQNTEDFEAARQESGADVEAGKRNGATVLAFRAQRCFYLSLSFDQAGKSSESFALLARAEAHAASAVQHHRDCKEPSASDLAEVKALQSDISAQRALVKALSCLRSVNDEKGEGEEKSQDAAAVGKRSIADQPLKYESGYKGEAVLSNFPPEFEPIPCKPVLFDLALSCAEFPSLEEKTKPAGGGFFSFWRS